MGVFGCSSIRGVCNADIGCGAKTLRWASVRECHPSGSKLSADRRRVRNALGHGAWRAGGLALVLPLAFAGRRFRTWRCLSRAPRGRAGGRDRAVTGVAATHPPLCVRPAQRGRSASALRCLGAARWPRHNLLAHSNWERLRPAPQSAALACGRRDPVGYRRHRASSTALNSLCSASVRECHPARSPRFRRE